jgi:hypothetical protein
VKLDTRSKILPLSRATAEYPDALFVAMHLDPLTVAHARRLAELASGGKPVVVVLSDPPHPLLPLAARAELAASLECVTAVMVAAAPCPLPPGAVIVSEESADLERRAALVRHVLARHAAASTMA